MQKHLRCWCGAAIALVLGSCAYDPNYLAGGSSSGGYDGGAGYGEGYGYGGSSFSTSLFISTGNPRWGYDPYSYCYYDYQRRCYYDPYLYGYYPVGYRPLLVVGVPHPYGYNRSYCPPPSRVTSITLSNYHNREAAYRSSNYGWAHQVHQQPFAARNQPQFQQRSAPYPRSSSVHEPATRYPSPPPSGFYQARSASPAARYPAAQPGNYNNPTGRANPQGAGVQTADPRHGPATPAYQGGALPRTAGAAPQHQAPAAATQGRGEGRGQKEGRSPADR
ncbi:MAG: hypothetical protein DVB26_00505 [Verrucomicrobia bacterium]|nr:MAG: hypothetical protein DVB26_00505 [Verrucomicrobiota bacterium]